MISVMVLPRRAQRNLEDFAAECRHFKVNKHTCLNAGCRNPHNDTPSRSLRQLILDPVQSFE
jgi:hypothetical protein